MFWKKKRRIILIKYLNQYEESIILSFINAFNCQFTS